jgi:hypothetical protein
MASDIPPNEDGITKYFGGFQDASGRALKDNKTLRVFVRLRSNMSLRDIKSNTGFFQWLKENKIFLGTHGLTSTYDVATAGFISRMSPTLHCCDTVNAIIQRTPQQQTPDLEVHLVPNRVPLAKVIKSFIRQLLNFRLIRSIFTSLVNFSSSFLTLRRILSPALGYLFCTHPHQWHFGL